MSQKQRIIYDSALDALVAVVKQLSLFEDRHRISSEDFFHRFSSGQMEDTAEFVEWSNAYQHFLSLRSILEKQVCHAA
jgi:predicted LPLAT superfamily acyltransferase